MNCTLWYTVFALILNDTAIVESRNETATGADRVSDDGPALSERNPCKSRNGRCASSGACQLPDSGEGSFILRTGERNAVTCVVPAASAYCGCRPSDQATTLP